MAVHPQKLKCVPVFEPQKFEIVIGMMLIYLMFSLLMPALREAIDARRKLAVLRYDYNNVRPHSSLGIERRQKRWAFLQIESVPAIQTLLHASKLR